MQETMQAGGPMMWPLLLLWLISLAILLERTQFWIRLARSPRQGVSQQGAQEFHAMKKYLAWLDTIIPAAPLLGILGTVMQIMRTFQTVGGSGVPDSKALMSGMAQAFIPTAFGLVVAILTLFSSHFFRGKAHRAHEAMQERASSLEFLPASKNGAAGMPGGKQAQSSPSDRPAETPAESLIRSGVPAKTLGGLSEKEKKFFLS